MGSAVGWGVGCGTQDVAPVAGVKRPAAHFRQRNCPEAAWYVFNAHATHDAMPVSAAIFPDEHLVHDSAPASE